MFSPFAGSESRSCGTCAASIGTSDGWHLGRTTSRRYGHQARWRNRPPSATPADGDFF